VLDLSDEYGGELTYSLADAAAGAFFFHNEMGVLWTPDDGIVGTFPGAECAACTFLHIDVEYAKFAAYIGPAFAVEDVLFELIPEFGQCAEQRIRGILSKTA